MIKGICSDSKDIPLPQTAAQLDHYNFLALLSKEVMNLWGPIIGTERNDTLLFEKLKVTARLMEPYTSASTGKRFRYLLVLVHDETVEQDPKEGWRYYYSTECPAPRARLNDRELADCVTIALKFIADFQAAKQDQQFKAMCDEMQMGSFRWGGSILAQIKRPDPGPWGKDAFELSQNPETLLRLLVGILYWAPRQEEPNVAYFRCDPVKVGQCVGVIPDGVRDVVDDLRLVVVDPDDQLIRKFYLLESKP